MRDMLNTVKAWLPHPVYRFVGGPFDGQKLAVDLIETDEGLVAPRLWRLYGAQSPPISFKPVPPDAMEVVVEAHTYRFVPRSMNEGHYEWIAP